MTSLTFYIGINDDHCTNVPACLIICVICEMVLRHPQTSVNGVVLVSVPNLDYHVGYLICLY